jgi:hypothetical protein
MSSKTTVANLRREPYDVYIGRAGHGQDGYFGNPIRLGRKNTREDVLHQYAKWFAERVRTDADFRRRVLALRGKRLGCFCKPLACHGDVIAVWVDAQIVSESTEHVLVDAGNGYVKQENK